MVDVAPLIGLPPCVQSYINEQRMDAKHHTAPSTAEELAEFNKENHEDRSGGSSRLLLLLATDASCSAVADSSCCAAANAADCLPPAVSLPRWLPSTAVV